MHSFYARARTLLIANLTTPTMITAVLLKKKQPSQSYNVASTSFNEQTVVYYAE